MLFRSQWSNAGSLAAAVTPSAPRSLVLKRVGTALNLTWQLPTTMGTFPWQGYRVEMRIGTAAWKVVAAKAVLKTFTLKKPLKGKKYSFRVSMLTQLPGPASPVKYLVW